MKSVDYNTMCNVEHIKHNTDISHLGQVFRINVLTAGMRNLILEKTFNQSDLVKRRGGSGVGSIPAASILQEYDRQPTKLSTLLDCNVLGCIIHLVSVYPKG